MRNTTRRYLLWALPLLLAATASVWLAGSGRNVAQIRNRAAENTRRTILLERVSGLDSVRVSGQGTSALASSIYECLYQYHYLKRPYAVVPCLAADMPQASGECSFTIRLRDDLRFQDDACFPDGRGRKVTAADVIYSWKRLADPHNASQHWSLLIGRVKGLDDFREYAKGQPKDAVDYDKPVEGLSADNALALTITLTRPWPQFLYTMAALPTAVVAREAVERYGDDLARHPVGTGPYRVETWRDGADIVLSRNPHFREELYPSDGAPGDQESGLLEDAGQRLPFIDRLSFRVCQADQTTWLMLMQGDLDAHGVNAGNFSDVVNVDGTLTEEMKAAGLALDVFPAACSRWIGLNLADPLMKSNKPLRQALSLSFDRQEFNKLILNSRSKPPHSLIPPCLKEHDPNLKHPLLEHNLERALALKKQADTLNGTPITRLRMIMGGTTPVMRQVGQLFQQWVSRIGIELELDMVDEASMPQRMKEHPAQVIFATGFAAQSPDVSAVFRSFYGPNDETGGNPSHYHNPAFDRLFEKAVAMPDCDERTQLYREMEKTVLDDMPCVPFLDYTWLFVHYRWLKNYKPHAFFGPSGASKYQRLDLAQRVKHVEGLGAR